MEEDKLIVMYEGFTPKSYANISDEVADEIIEETGIEEILNTDIDALFEQWIEAFKAINTDVIKNLPEGFETSTLQTIDIQDEVHKVSEIVGNTIAFAYYNASKRDWFNLISEYLVYMNYSIGSIAGSIFYWLTMQYFFREDGIAHAKSQQLLNFIENNSELVTNHKYSDEVNTLAQTYPFELLNVDELDLSGLAAVFLLYPNGILNRFIAEHLPNVPKKLSKQRIAKIIDGQVKSALRDFSIEEIWNDGNVDRIREFLKEGIIHKNNITNYSLLNASAPEYLETIKTWIGNQIDGLKDLNDVEKLEIARPQGVQSKEKIQAKYYALYHLILVALKEENDFPRDEFDRYNRKDIEAFAAEKYPHISAQGFYRAYLNNDISNKEAIVIDNKDFKKRLSIIAKNSPKVLQYLKKFPG